MSESLTGSRIRERRLNAGLRQADLAQQVGISASYLNLIEHNRRRIGGKLLMDIAGVLGVEPSMLSEGAEATLIAGLREMAADLAGGDGRYGDPAEIERIDEFAERFPGWAGLLLAAGRQIERLERTAETLSDRLAHDPQLATSMHEVLSTVTAIRSTAGILADTKEIEPEWRARFHRNINEDSQRLAESSKRLVAYLDGANDVSASLSSPQEEVEAMLAARGYHCAELEGSKPDLGAVAGEIRALGSEAAQNHARRVLTTYIRDAERLPLRAFARAIARRGLDIAGLAEEFGVSLPRVFRRLAVMPEEAMPHKVGLVVSDMAGALVFRKPIEGFVLPRFDAGCPKWPLFQAQTRPNVPIRRRVMQTGRDAPRFECYATTAHIGADPFASEPFYYAYMLIIPITTPPDPEEAPLAIGPACRICARETCEARREASILYGEI